MVAGCLVAIAVLTGLQIARQPVVPAYDTIWAEDGQIFLSQAFERPFSLFEPYAGYINLVPRLVATVAAASTATLAAAILSVGAALIVSGLALYVFVGSRTAFPTVLPRIVLAGLVPLLPAAGFESLNNMSNIQFFLLFACFWAIIAERRSPARIGVDAVVVAVTVLTSALAALYLPLVYLRTRRSSQHGQLAVSAAFVLGVLVQIAAFFGGGSAEGSGVALWEGWSPLRMPILFGTTVGAPLLVGYGFVGEASGTGVIVLGWAANAAVISLALTVLFRRFPHRMVAVAALSYSLAFFAFPAVLRPGSAAAMPSLLGNRFVLLPMWFLVTAVLVVLFADPTGGRRVQGMLGGLFVGLTGALILLNFSFVNPRARGPLWSDQLSEGSSVCKERSPPTVRLRVTPNGDSGWYATVPCRWIGG